jgi:ferric-dicitrate binding protein FerR (iron transport regulator)
MNFSGAWAAWLRNGLAGLALILALASVVLSVEIRGVQDHVEGQRADAVKAQAIVQVDGSVIQLLARTAVEKNDPQIRALLTTVGVTIGTQPAPSGAPATTQAAPAPGGNP